jgi:hypothetical protein
MDDILKDYIRDGEFAAAVGKTPRTIRIWRQRRTGPAWVRIGNGIFYRRTAVQEWLSANEVRPARRRPADQQSA